MHVFQKPLLTRDSQILFASQNGKKKKKVFVFLAGMPALPSEHQNPRLPQARSLRATGFIGYENTTENTLNDIPIHGECACAGSRAGIVSSWAEGSDAFVADGALFTFTLSIRRAHDPANRSS